jgi:DNA-binding SARP family transcriptional activator
MTLRIMTFGTLSVRGERGTLAGAAAQPRRLALLALLARAGDRGVTREKLTALVWPDADDERSRRAITQAIYALRQELGSDDAILGVKELRLDSTLVGSDVGDFTAALRAGRIEDAVRMYAGPFLDGFHLLGNDEFDRWVDEERAVLSQDYCEALEKLAMAADASGNHTTATRWWRRLAARDPLCARYAVGVMQALAAAGDRHGALEHARIHETLLEQQLDLPADRDVVALAARIRRELRAGAREEAAQQAAETAVAVADPVPAPMPNGMDVGALEPSDVELVSTLATASPSIAPASRRIEARMQPEPAAAPSRAESPDAKGARQPRRRAALVVATIGLAAAATIVVRARGIPGASEPTPVVAVGRITDYGVTPDQRYGLPLADLLSTNLARVPGMRVVSAGRMLELMRQSSTGPGSDTSAAVMLGAARLAGATELIDGTIYSRPGGLLRLDLRRVGVRTGDIIQAQTIEGADLFALVDSGTARLVAAHGGAPPGAVAGVTTKSVAAYSLYAQGLRSNADGDAAGARRLFAAALREDSAFAMAAFHYGRLAGNRTELVAGLARALRLSATATERERLMIRAGWAWAMSARELGAVAESLVTRYPQEAQGHLYEGIARLQIGDFLGAIAPLERVVAMDSLSFTRANNNVGCDACTAMLQLVLTYMQADSLAAAERAARRWTRLEPESARPWLSLWDVLERAGRFADADEAAASVAKLDRDAIGATDRTAIQAIRRGNFELADRVLRAAIQGGNVAAQMDALWDLNVSLRYQGRVDEAIVVARRFRELADQTEHSAAGATPGVRPLAQSLFDAGRYREAAALFDSSARWRAPEESDFSVARERAWNLAHAARCLAAAGDTSGLAARADTIEAVGALSASGRDRGLALHVRGLLLFARGDLPGAAAAFRRSIYSVPAGYTRENYDLARTLLLLGQPREAVAVLQPVMRGKLDASNFYVTQTEVHEMLAQAWDAAGRPDSASMHYARVARAWEHGDPAYAKRAAEARRHVSPTITRR